MTYNFGWMEYHVSLILGVWSELSEEVASGLSKSVVLLAVVDGDYMCCFTLLFQTY